MTRELPLLPTTVCGSHALPSWHDFSFARAHADRLLRVAVPGPMTLLMPLRRGGPYATEDALVADLVAIVNRELRALVDAGCELLQVDEPNYVMSAGKHRVLRAGPGLMLEALWETPRWVAVSKLRSMVEAARLLRRELSGKS